MNEHADGKIEIGLIEIANTKCKKKIFRKTCIGKFVIKFLPIIKSFHKFSFVSEVGIEIVTVVMVTKRNNLITSHIFKEFKFLS